MPTMTIRTLSMILCLWAGMLFLPGVTAGESGLEGVAHILRTRLANNGTPQTVEISGKILPVSPLLPSFYKKRGYLPAWFDELGIVDQAGDFISIIKNAEAEGLRPDFYHASLIGDIATKLHEYRQNGTPVPIDDIIDLDLLLTDSFLLYSSDMIAGRVNPAVLEGEWSNNGWEADLAAHLRRALDLNAIEEAVDVLTPPHQGYYDLKAVLSHYMDIASAGGWPTIPDGPLLKRGSRGDRVASLRCRLAITADLEVTDDVGTNVFDETTEQAVRNFQKRNGLAPDGVVGPITLAALNIPVDERIHQLEINMERWRWLPQNLGERYIFINSADFRMEVIEHGETVLSMRAIVGEPYRDTPNFSAQLTHIVLNPSWYVPVSIATDELLPKIRNDRHYLERNGFVVQSTSGDSIDGSTVDWKTVTEDDFPFRVVQSHGPLNPLGLIKFVFPNPFSVYLHDTPAKSLFSENIRTFSHGCIRIEKPLDLATYLLSDDPSWTHESIRAAIDDDVEQAVFLAKPINVHVLYWTAWVDDKGVTHFREDVYGRDKPLEDALLQASTDSFNICNNGCE